MSLYYRKHGKPEELVYDDGRTKQAFIDDCDINKIIAKAQVAGTLSHLEKHGAVYADFSDAPTDLMEAKQRIEGGQRIFNELPSELRREFKNDQFAFFEYVNDPANADRLPELLPELAKPGTQLPDVARRALYASQAQTAPTAPQNTENAPEAPSEPPESE